MSSISRSSTPLGYGYAAGGASSATSSSGALGVGASNTGAGGLQAGSSGTRYLGVTRSRTLLFQSYRDSVPRSRFGNSSAYSDSPLSSSSKAKGKGKLRWSEDGERAGVGSTYDEDGDEHAGLLNGASHPAGSSSASSYPPPGGHTSIDLSTLPPKWVDTSEEVDAVMNTSIRTKMVQLDKLHAKHLLPSFTDRSKEEREIETLTTEITREFRKCSRLISTLAQHTLRSQAAATRDKGQQGQGGPSSMPILTQREIALAQNVQTALATKVQDLSGVFRKKQSVYLQKLKGMEVRGRDLAVASGMLSKHGVLHRDNEAAVREDMELSSQQLRKGPSDALLLLEEQEQAQLQQDPTLADANIQQRDREITHIAKSIAELAELFQDLSALVIEQGTMVDRIDWNVENMGKDMQAAVEELNTANRYQRRTGRAQCIMFLLLCIALLIAIIIIKPFWRAASRKS